MPTPVPRWLLLLALLLAIRCLRPSSGKRQHDGDKAKNLIILVGLPKSGTTTLHDAFLNHGIQSIHFHVPYQADNLNAYQKEVDLLCPDDVVPAVTVGGNSTRAVFWHAIEGLIQNKNNTNKKKKTHNFCYVGSIVQRAIAHDRDPLHYMIAQGYTAFTQLDVCYPPAVCIWPQFEAIEEITNAYPDAIYIHTRRISVDVHVGSLTAWAPVNPFIERLKATGYLSTFPSQSQNETDVDNLKHFVREVTRRTVQYFAKRPWLHFMDIAIEDPSAGERLSQLLGWPNFTLPRSNVGNYHGASPTQANLTLWSGDDYEDDAGAGDPKRVHPQEPAHDVEKGDDDDSNVDAEAGRSSSGSSKGKSSKGKNGEKSGSNSGGKVPGKGLPPSSAKDAAAAPTSAADTASAPLTALPYSCARSGVDLPSLLLGMLLGSCVCGALRVCQSGAGRFGPTGRAQKLSGRGGSDKRDVKYSPLPVSDRTGKGGSLELTDASGSRHGRQSLGADVSERALWEEHEQEYELGDEGEGEVEFGLMHNVHNGCEGEEGDWVETSSPDVVDQDE